ncbi:MAG TPA: phosphoribosylformylglycinamidine synthase subunit PurQ [Balneolales bacterium]|nr:phosphoribosylformylglycinamidine synthase subunit PurQ [Balneolales bacterium]
MANKFGVIVFPGSNCDHDAYHAAGHVMGAETQFIWHKETKLDDFDVVILPGGFSYGDYLRSGAIARFSPIMENIIQYANKGGLVLGICNGFQILLESGLLPGALLHNTNLRFICKNIHLRCENRNTPFTKKISDNQVLTMPIAHGEGNYYTDPDTLKSLEDNQQVIFRYCNEYGEITEESNPNGSLQNIAGICNKQKNVLGMMPHPERVVENELGSTDGKVIFDSIISALQIA